MSTRLFSVVESGIELSVLEEYGGVLSASFSLDGEHIVLSSGKFIRIEDFPSLQDLIDQTRERFKDRPLTPEERYQYYLE